jgi:hypothetical protein
MMKYKLLISIHTRGLEDDEPARVVGRLIKDGVVQHSIDVQLPIDQAQSLVSLMTGSLHEENAFLTARHIAALVDAVCDALLEQGANIGAGVSLAETVVYLNGDVIPLIETANKTRASEAVSSTIFVDGQPARLVFNE